LARVVDARICRARVAIVAIGCLGAARQVPEHCALLADASVGGAGISIFTIRSLVARTRPEMGTASHGTAAVRRASVPVVTVGCAPTLAHPSTAHFNAVTGIAVAAGRSVGSKHAATTRCTAVGRTHIAIVADSGHTGLAHEAAAHVAIRAGIAI
jgi:hypothetical protein